MMKIFLVAFLILVAGCEKEPEPVIGKTIICCINYICDSYTVLNQRERSFMPFVMPFVLVKNKDDKMFEFLAESCYF